MKGVFPLVLMITMIGLAGCLVDKGELIEELPAGYCDSLQANYVDTMKILIDLHCAKAGCHVAGFSSGDFSTYASMQSFGALEQGKIGVQVASGNMPQGSTLSDSTKAVFQCWAESGFPQQ